MPSLKTFVRLLNTDNPHVWMFLFFYFSLLSAILNSAMVRSLYFEYYSFTMLCQGGTVLIATELLRSSTSLRLPIPSLSLFFHSFVPSLFLCTASCITYFSLGLLWIPGFERVKRLTPLVSLTVTCCLLGHNFRRTLTKEKIVCILVVSVATFTGACLHITSIDQPSLHWGTIAIATQLIAFFSLKGLLMRYQVTDLIYIQYCITTLITFGVELYQHDIKPVLLYVSHFRFPLFPLVFVSLILLTPLTHYACLRCLQLTDVVTVSVISNVRHSVQFLLSYFFYRYVFHQKTYEEYTFNNIFFCAIATLFGILYCCKRGSSLPVTHV